MGSTKIVLILTTVLCSHLVVCWDQSMRDLILKIHNDYRSDVKPAACQMNAMVYDMSLESQAETWVKGCNYKHEMKPNRGENLAFMAGYLADKPGPDLVKDASKAWYDEVNVYTYGQKSCSRSCHYTQMVAAETTRVGCYAKVCPNLLSVNIKDAWYFACFYTPFANWVGQPPYKTKCSTPCEEGLNLVNGLCVGESSNNGNEEQGGDSNNGNEEQGGGSNNGNEGQGGESNNGNQGTGGESTNGNQGTGGESTNGNQGTGGESTNGNQGTGGCKDTDKNCGYWTSINQCVDNPVTMKHYCPASCGVCDESNNGNKEEQGDCKDASEGCEYWKSVNQCVDNAITMKHYCPLTCGMCD